jgi:opacity protein-like surface antigen
MKKHLIALLGALMAQQASATHNKAGSKFFIEVSTGTGFLYSNPTGTDRDTLSPIDGALSPLLDVYDYRIQTLRAKKGGAGITGLLGFGYDCKLPNSLFLMGVSVAGGVSKMDVANPYDGFDFVHVYNVNYVNPCALNVSTRGRLQALLRFGFLATDSILTFINIGWSTFNTEAKLNRKTTIGNGSNITILANNATNWQNVLITQKIKKWANCLAVGMGLELNITRSFVLGMQANVHIGKKKTYSFSDSKFTLADGEFSHPVVTIHPVIAEALLTLKYAMPTCGN